MSLAFKGWTMIARQALTAATPAGVLTDIENMLDGVGGWAVEVDADTFGIALTPPGTGLDDDLQIILAGKAASIGTPTMATVNNVTALDTATTGVLMCGMVHGLTGATPAALNWDAASPLSAGTFTGYIRGFTCASNSHITLFYTEEAVAIVLDNNANGTTKPIIIGATVDPHSVNAGDCHTNGRLYHMAVCGSVATTGIATTVAGSTSTANSTTGNRMFDHGTADGNGHSLVVDPTTGYNQVAVRTTALLQNPSSQVSPGGRYLPHPIGLVRTIDLKAIGFARAMGYHATALHATNRSINTGTIGSPVYTTGGSILGTGLSTVQEGFFMQKVEALA